MFHGTPTRAALPRPNQPGLFAVPSRGFDLDQVERALKTPSAYVCVYVCGASEGEAGKMKEATKLRRPPCFATLSRRLRVYGSSETNFRYSASGHARAVLVCTLPREPTARQNLATASPLGASIALFFCWVETLMKFQLPCSLLCYCMHYNSAEQAWR